MSAPALLKPVAFVGRGALALGALWRRWALSPAEFVGLAFVVAISYYLVFVAQ